MDDKYFALFILIFIVGNFIVGLVQKARAEEKRRQRSTQKTQKKPEIPVSSGPQVRPQATTTVRRQAPARRPVPERQLARPRQAPQRASRTQDVLREWAKRLEEALQPVEPTPEPPPEPVQAVAPTPAASGVTVREAPRSVPPGQRFDAYKRPARGPSVAFLGDLHANPIVNGIILSEILSRPVALRRDESTLLH